jgi:hypothetical protein
LLLQLRHCCKHPVVTFLQRQSCKLLYILFETVYTESAFFFFCTEIFVFLSTINMWNLYWSHASRSCFSMTVNALYKFKGIILAVPTFRSCLYLPNVHECSVCKAWNYRFLLQG